MGSVDELGMAVQFGGRKHIGAPAQSPFCLDRMMMIRIVGMLAMLRWGLGDVCGILTSLVLAECRDCNYILARLILGIATQRYQLFLNLP